MYSFYLDKNKKKEKKNLLTLKRAFFDIMIFYKYSFIYQ